MNSGRREKNRARARWRHECVDGMVRFDRGIIRDERNRERRDAIAEGLAE